MTPCKYEFYNNEITQGEEKGFSGGPAVKDPPPPPMQGTQVRSLGQEDPLEERGQPSPVLLPGESHGQRSLEGYSPWGRKELDMSEMTKHVHTEGKERRTLMFSM